MKPALLLQVFAALLCGSAGCEFDAEVTAPDAGRAGAYPWAEFEPDLCGEATRVLCSVPLPETTEADTDADAEEAGTDASDASSSDTGLVDGAPGDGASSGDSGEETETADDPVVWCAVSCLRPCGQETRWQCHGQPVCSTDRDARPPSCGDIEARLDAGRPLKDTGTDGDAEAD